jgi:threonine dehydrogenase-like Zn-dependent dehydrogenase
VLHAIDRVTLRPGERVAILGCGGIGLLLLQASRAVGATVAIAVDPVAERRELAVELGAQNAAAPDDLQEPVGYREKVDVVFEVSGQPSSVARALDLIRPGGRVALVGYLPHASHPIETAKLPLTYGTLVGVMGPGGKFGKAVDLLAERVVDARAHLTDVVTLDDWAGALDRAMNRTSGTVRVTFDLRGE